MPEELEDALNELGAIEWPEDRIDYLNELIDKFGEHEYLLTLLDSEIEEMEAQERWKDECRVLSEQRMREAEYEGESIDTVEDYVRSLLMDPD